MMALRRDDDLSQETAHLIGDFLAAIATAGSVGSATRCFNFHGFQSNVVERLVSRLKELAPEATVKVDLAYRSNTSLPESLYLNPQIEGFTTYRNRRSGITVLIPHQALGDERESLESVETRDPDDIRSHVEGLLSMVGGARQRFADEFDGLVQFIKTLVEVAHPALHELVGYMLRIFQLRTQGEITVYALGEALPELGAFRYREAFRSVSLKDPNKHPRWRSAIESAVFTNREYAFKRSPTGFLKPEELEQNLLAAAAEIGDAEPVLREFIRAPATDDAIRLKALQLDWKSNGVHLIFKRSSRERLGLGEATHAHLLATELGSVPSPDSALLKEVDERPDIFEEDRDRLLDFYDRYRAALASSRNLANRWERRLFPQSIEEADLLLGLLKATFDLIREVDPHRTGSLRLRVKLNHSAQAILESLSRDAVLFFATRYRGLQSLLGPHVELHFESLCRVEEWDQKTEAEVYIDPPLPEATRTALDGFRKDPRMTRGGNRLEFEVELLRAEDGKQAIRVPGGIKKIVWTFPGRSFLAGFPFDLALHRMSPLRYYRLPRSLSSPKGVQPPLALDSPDCIETSKSRDLGHLVGVIDSEIIDIRALVNKGVADMRDLVTPTSTDQVQKLVDELDTELKKALNAFAEEGLAWAAWQAFAIRYGEILAALVQESSGERFARAVIAPILLSGVAFVGPSDHTAIVSPLHPLRLVSLYVKAHQAVRLLAELLDEQTPAIDADLFLSALECEFGHSYYPELLCGHSELMIEESNLGSYSLYTGVSQHKGRMGSRPKEAAKVLRAVVKDYISLHPHEKANLSILLHSVSVERFPQAVVEEFSKAATAELAGAKCRLALREPDGLRLQTHYRDFVGAMGADQEAADTDLTFLSRFGVTAIGGHAKPRMVKTGDIDIAFLYDRVTSSASIRWQSLPQKLADALVDIVGHSPAQWLRKQPSDARSMRSSNYICCPVNPKPVVEYYRSVAACSMPDHDPNRMAVPVQEVRYDAEDVQKVLLESHDVAKWVVNYDYLLDRQQLERLGVQVIRYRPSREAGRNLIISSTERDHVVQSHLKTRMLRFDLMPSAQLDGCVSSIIRRANEVSGNLVLTAAGRGYFTNELLGAVLSASVLRQRLPSHLAARSTMVYLDDYGTLFAHGAKMAGDADRPSGLLADLLCIVPEVAEGRVRLTVLVSEAKFLDSTGSVVAEAQKSQRQLIATLRKLAWVLGPEPAIDRDRWLATISNVLVDVGRRAKQNDYDPEEVTWYVRRGQIDVALEGHSHIFVAPDGVRTEWSAIPDIEHAWQGIIARPQTAALLRSICCPDSPLDSAALLGPLGGLPLSPRPRGKESPGASTNERSGQRTQEGSSGYGEGQEEGDEQPAPHRYPWARETVAELLTEIQSQAGAPVSQPNWLAQVAETERRVKDFLPRVKVRAQLGHSSVTPNAFRIRIEGQVGVDAARLEKLRDEFKTVMGLELIRVEPEPGYFALSFRRPERGLVTYLSCLQEREVSVPDANTRVILGRREDNGSLVYFDFGGEDPHALVGGMSNSGKSQLLRMMILDMALTNDPDHLRLILVDPKHVEFSRFRKLKHLRGNSIVVTKESAISMLHDLVGEMETRYNVLAEWEVNNLLKYNQIQGRRPMPRIVVVFDEFADWMLDDDFKRTVNEGFQRLAGKARAAGIHLILSTQRPDNTVVSPILRANLGGKIALRVDKKANSEIILDEGGAQHLLGKGHGLARLGGEKFLFQTAFVPDEVLERLVKGLEDAYGNCDEGAGAAGV